jgi:hypothetical protein
MLGDAGVIGTTDCPSLTLLLEHCIYTHTHCVRGTFRGRIWPTCGARRLLAIPYIVNHVPCSLSHTATDQSLYSVSVEPRTYSIEKPELL